MSDNTNTLILESLFEDALCEGMSEREALKEANRKFQELSEQV